MPLRSSGCRSANGTAPAPNLPSNGNIVPGNNIASLADMLPADDVIEEINFYSRLTTILFYILKILFLFVVCANVISLFLDPTPLVRVYNFLTRPPVDDDVECKIPKPTDTDDINFKYISTKLDILREDLNKLQEKLDITDKWRSDLEYELAKTHRKNLRQCFMEIEKRFEEALSIYDADKLGMMDYALETAGGRIISTPDTVPFPSSVSWDFVYFQVLSASSAANVIRAGTLPGECFAFHGTTGRIRIRLAEEIKITSVTLEHAPFRLLSDISSCPKNFSVLGVEKPEQKNGTELGQFTFKNGSALQNFKIIIPKIYQHVELFIMDNYGKKEYTCVYRFRVHGIPNV